MFYPNESTPHAVRLVLFPRQGADMWTAQFTELTYRYGWPTMSGGEHVTLYAGDWDAGDAWARREALWSAAGHLRRVY